MKKFISLLLALVLVFGTVVVVSATDSNETEHTKYPVILVPGFTSTALYRIDEETGEEIVVWDDPVSQVAGGASLESLVPDFKTYLLEGDVKPLAKKLGEGFTRIFGDMKCNPDGTSYYDVKAYIDSAEDGNYANLIEKYPDGKHQFEKELMAELSETVGYENLYVFSSDFRMGAIENAEKLKIYIDDVISYTNELKAEKGEEPVDKVNIFCLSHGGQITGTYLTLYGYEGKVNNAVLTCPALGGAGIAYDAFNGEINFDEIGLLIFIQHAFMLEDDFQILVMAEQLGFIDELIEALLPYVLETLGCWGSLWDFIPLEEYEAVKEKCLDENIHAGLIAKSDRMHYDIIDREGKNNYADGFEKARRAGTNIYNISGYDNKIITGMEVDSDAILPTAGCTGATVAPFGKRFADGYTQINDTGFYQVSPSMTVDASTAYLPEHTWFIENYYHGMTIKDEFTYTLVKKLLLTDESFDVHSFEEYPQFHATSNPAHTIWATFNNSTEGYVSDEDTALVIRNLSSERNVIITAVDVEGANISLDFAPFTLKAGESKEIAIKGEIPAVSVKNFEINVSYFAESVIPVGGRTFEFTIMNGERAEYDAENPYTDADQGLRMDIVIDKDVKMLVIMDFVEKLISVIHFVVMKLSEVLGIIAGAVA